MDRMLDVFKFEMVENIVLFAKTELSVIIFDKKIVGDIIANQFYIEIEVFLLNGL